EHDRFQIRQPRNCILDNSVEWLRNTSGVSVEIEPFHLKASGQMNFPHALERQLIQKFLERLAPINAVAIDIVKIEQQTAVRHLNYPRDEFTVRQLVRPGSQITHAGLNRDRNVQRVTQALNRTGGSPHARRRLAWRQEEAGCEIRSVIETQVVAGPRRLKVIDRGFKQMQFSRFGSDCSSDGPADTVNYLAARQTGKMFEDAIVDAERQLRVFGFDPQSLR